MAEWNPRANDIFVRAAEIDSPADRRLFVDQQCDGDADLRAQVDSLLAAGGQIGSFLDRPAVAAPPADVQTGAYRPLTEGPGTVIGPYKLLQHIGEGGFGAVYMAEQEHPVRRKVALKIIKPGMDTREVIARFESERQALALMDHPNIARVLDAGATDSGRPYFVMELVRGIPITEFCDRNKLPAEQRLRLFVAVCNAVQHAHHKGIIHRDIKPSNVMVTLHDGVPVVKVIDFGVAKATAQKLTERTLFTAYGQMVGTPAYMSPEQAEMSGLDIDTRSDIYSLGVLLYELLTGTTPLDTKKLRQAGYAEMQRLIREEEAPRPSTRFSSLGGEATALAINRSSDVKRLSQMLRSDLDWVVMKALEKDRNRRYGSPANFAADIERYLTEQPVEACPPSAWYRFRKAYRRNKAALATAAVVAAALVLGAAVSLWQAIRARDSESAAVAARDAEADQRAAAVSAAEETARQRDEARAARDELRHALYATDVQMAASLWQAKDRGRTLEVLDRQRPKPGEPDLRGFEWHFLNRQSRSAARTLPLPEGIKRFTPDGRRVYVVQRADQRKDGRRETTLRGLDLTTGQELPEWEPFPGQDVTFLSVAGFNRTGSRVLVAYRTGAAERGQPRLTSYKVFDRESRKELFALKDLTVTLSTPVLDDQGQLLAVKDPDASTRPASAVTVWSVDEQKVAQTISVDAAKGEVFAQTGWAFHPNGKQFAAVVVSPGSEPSSFLELRVWDIRSGKAVWRLPIKAGTSLTTLAYSPDGKSLAETSHESDVVNIRKAEDGQVVHTLRLPNTSTQWMKNFFFSPNGSRLAVSLSDQAGVHVWDIPEFPSIGDLPPSRSIPTDRPSSRVGFSGDARSVFVTSSASSGLSVYDLGVRALALPCPDDIRSPYATGPETIRRPVIVLGPYKDHGLAWALWKVGSPDSPKAEVRAWDSGGREVFRVRCDSLEDAYAGATTRDGHRFVLVQSSTHPSDPARDRSRVQVWDLKTRAELFVGELPGGRVRVWGIDPEGRTLAISRRLRDRPLKPREDNPRERLSLWDLPNSKEIRGEEIDGVVRGAEMTLDGSRVAWCLELDKPTVKSEVRVWDAATGRAVWSRGDWGTRDNVLQPGRPAFSRDGRTLALACYRPTGAPIIVLDAATGADRCPPIYNPDGSLVDLRLDADGRRLFALATRQTAVPGVAESVVVWDLVSGRKLLNLPVSNVSAMTIDREGRRVYLMKDVLGAGRLELETFDGSPRGDDQ